jgi:hypothetical protein
MIWPGPRGDGGCSPAGSGSARRSRGCRRSGAPAPSRDQLSRLSNGRVVSTVADGLRRFDVVLRLPERQRTTGVGLDHEATAGVLPQDLVRPVGLADVGDLARRHPVLRLPERQRTTAGLGDLLVETPSGWVPARQIADIGGSPRRCSSCRCCRRCWPGPRGDGGCSPAGSGSARRSRGATGGQLPGAGGGEPYHRAAVGAVARDDLRDPLQPLPTESGWPAIHRAATLPTSASGTLPITISARAAER